MPTSVLRRAPRAPKIATPVVRCMANAMLTALGLERAELSVFLTDDRTIRKLNALHRAKDCPTDVLAFPIDEKSRDPERVLGDVVISLETAARQARSRRRKLVAEVRFLLAHGLLHLIGHDHGTPAQKRKMDLWARRLVSAARSFGLRACDVPDRARQAAGAWGVRQAGARRVIKPGAKGRC